MKKAGTLLSIAAVVVLAAVVLVVWGASRAKGVPESAAAQHPELLAAFNGQGTLTRNDFLDLEGYFQNGFAAYRDPSGATASYPGLHSSHGRHVDSIEGFTRMAPLLAAYLHAQSAPLPDRAQQGQQFLLEGWSHGADPASPAYWGKIADDDQRIVEAADVALSIWLLRDSLWLKLPAADRSNVIAWLLQVNHRHTPDNNWHLFVTYVNLVVASLGYPADMQQAQEHYARFKTFYAGDGWFSDGPGKQFDYYNAWGIHYQLFWISQAAPSFDPDFIAKAIDAFAHKLEYLVGPAGLPMMGRSICYRMAIVAPLVFDQGLPHPSVPAGTARRALSLSWRYFIQHGGVRAGRITQGYCGFDARLLDSYSGPASCLWGLRSLVAALYLPASDKFWTAPEAPLPVECASYVLQYGQPGWTVIGQKSGVIVIRQASSAPGAKLAAESPWMALYDRIAGKAHRPENTDAKYHLPEYRSDTPFCQCAGN